jgi:protein-disulfide isomerase
MSLRIPVGPRDHVIGREDAPVTVVEYGDYQCPYCGAAQPQVRKVLAHFGDDIRFVFRHFPLTEVHPMAAIAAVTAEFAGVHGQFWAAHEKLYANQDRLGPELLFEIVQGLGLEPAELKAGIDADTWTQKVQEDFNGGIRSGVNGTPTFFINGARHDGAYSFESLSQAIEAARA